MAEQEKLTIYQLRKLKHLSVAECLSCFGGISRRHYYNVEQGKAVIYHKELERLAKRMGVSVQQIDTSKLIISYDD